LAASLEAPASYGERDGSTAPRGAACVDGGVAKAEAGEFGRAGALAAGTIARLSQAPSKVAAPRVRIEILEFFMPTFMLPP